MWCSRSDAECDPVSLYEALLKYERCCKVKDMDSPETVEMRHRRQTKFYDVMVFNIIQHENHIEQVGLVNFKMATSLDLIRD